MLPLDARRSLSPQPPGTVSVLGKRRGGGVESGPPVRTERLPAKTLLYRSVARNSGPSSSLDADGGASCVLPALDASDVFALAVPSPSEGMRVCEYVLQRAVPVLRSAEPVSEEVVRHHGCEGWRSACGGHVLLLSPATVLVLADDNKQAGVAQAFLTDMLFRNGLRS